MGMSNCGGRITLQASFATLHSLNLFRDRAIESRVLSCNRPRRDSGTAMSSFFATQYMHGCFPIQRRKQTFWIYVIVLNISMYLKKWKIPPKIRWKHAYHWVLRGRISYRWIHNLQTGRSSEAFLCNKKYDKVSFSENSVFIWNEITSTNNFCLHVLAWVLPCVNDIFTYKFSSEGPQLAKQGSKGSHLNCRGCPSLGKGRQRGLLVGCLVSEDWPLGAWAWKYLRPCLRQSSPTIPSCGLHGRRAHQVCKGDKRVVDIFIFVFFNMPVFMILYDHNLKLIQTYSLYSSRRLITFSSRLLTETNGAILTMQVVSCQVCNGR